MDLPAPVVRADHARHQILERVAFSRYLNPRNAESARRAFLRGASSPPFAYHPLVEADDLLRILDANEPPRDHPAGALVGSCFDDTRCLIVALRDRTPEAFDAMARMAGWYPDDALLGLTFEEGPPEYEPLSWSAQPVIQRLRDALNDRRLHDWTVVEDTVMAARVLVDGAKRLIRVNPDSRFRARDIERLVVHEIDVHAVRAANGMAQPLTCFQTGLPGSLATEEGLALVSEEHAGFSSPGMLARQVEVVRSIDLARRLPFQELFDSVAERCGPGLAWGICLRIKRGLADPSKPGVYAKDSVYLRGRMSVRAWLDDGGVLKHLYVGKVGVADPVEEWLAQGWVSEQPVSPTWRAYSS